MPVFHFIIGSNDEGALRVKHTYTMMIDLTGRRCLVVGGGPVAERKTRSLLSSQARVTVVSPTATLYLQQLARKQRITWWQRPYRSEDGEGCFLVIGATDQAAVNRAVYEDAIARQQWVNVVDQPELCNFTVPAVVQRGQLTIAVSTQGASPLLAKRVRQDLEKQYGEEYSLYVDLLAKARAYMLREVSDRSRRAAFLRQLLQEDWLLTICRQQPEDAEFYLEKWMQEQIGGTIHERDYRRVAPK